MGKLYITEYEGARQVDGGLSQVAEVNKSTDQSPVSFTTAVSSAAFGDGVKIIRVVSDINCHLAFGDAPAATANNLYLPANVVEYFGVLPGKKVSVYDGVS